MVPPYSETMIRATVAGVAVVVFLLDAAGRATPCGCPVTRISGSGVTTRRCFGAAGHDVVLHTRAGGTGSYRRGLFWEGVFADPGAQRIADADGSAAGSVSVHLRVAENDGSIGNANSTVPLSEGYG